MKTLISMTLVLVSLTGCAAKCKDVAEEKVSVCRAQAACRSPMSPIATVLGGMSGGQNPAVRNFNTCVDQNLSAQKASIGIADNTQRCETVVTSQNPVQFETVCR